jgi:hypothetical protein
MKNVTFEEIIEMGFLGPESELVDFSLQDYEKANQRVEIFEKNGMKCMFIDGQFKRMYGFGKWFAKVYSVEVATIFFKG